VRITNRETSPSRSFLDEERVIALTTATNPNANREAVADADVVIVAVKPAMMTTVIDEVSTALAPTSTVISVAAGVTTSTLSAHLPQGHAVVRAMPNTPATVGSAVTGLCAGSLTPAESLAQAVSIFETVGDVIVVDESLIDVVGAVSGSGPAYVFYLIESLVDCAIERGMNRGDAEVMVRGTFRGAVNLLDASSETPAQLRANVTSPGGSTERAIAEFEQSDLRGLLARAVDAAIKRQAEMGRDDGTRTN